MWRHTQKKKKNLSNWTTSSLQPKQMHSCDQCIINGYMTDIQQQEQSFRIGYMNLVLPLFLLRIVSNQLQTIPAADTSIQHVNRKTFSAQFSPTWSTNITHDGRYTP